MKKTKTNEHRVRTWIKRSLFLILILIFSAISYIFLSPSPIAWIVKKSFEGGMSVPPDHYAELVQQTRMIADIDYGSQYPNGKLDIIYPLNHTEQSPVVFWVHGGAFVGGDKSDITQYATQLAASGYPVVNINYALAPLEKYPTPLLQVSEAYRFIQEHAKEYGLSLDRVFFAGDSAGAQMTSQFVNIQTDPSYAAKTEIDGVVNPATIKGALLFCGPYELSKLSNIESGNLMKFLMRRIGWAYIGAKDWELQPQTQLASIVDYVTKDYPPVFITDGNVGSFEEHGRELASTLKSKSVPVESVFFDKSEGELGHEYQFLMNTEPAQHTFEQVIHFLERYQ